MHVEGLVGKIIDVLYSFIIFQGKILKEMDGWYKAGKILLFIVGDYI